MEIPPKLITKDVAEIAKKLFGKVERERLPFVISTTPCKRAERGVGRRLKNGINVVIMKDLSCFYGQVIQWRD